MGVFRVLGTAGGLHVGFRQSNAGLRREFADWLESIGETHRAKAQRWLAIRGTYPMHAPPEGMYFFSEGNRDFLTRHTDPNKSYETEKMYVDDAFPPCRGWHEDGEPDLGP